MGGRVVQGLNYQSVEAIFRIKNIPKKDRADLFRDLQVMEFAVLPIFNKAKD